MPRYFFFADSKNRMRAALPNFVKKMSVNLLRISWTNFDPRSYQIRSTDHVQWPHLKTKVWHHVTVIFLNQLFSIFQNLKRLLVPTTTCISRFFTSAVSGQVNFLTWPLNTVHTISSTSFTHRNTSIHSELCCLRSPLMTQVSAFISDPRKCYWGLPRSPTVLLPIAIFTRPYIWYPTFYSK